jgi:hypothetical protein
MIAIDSPVTKFQTLRAGTRVRDEGVGGVLYYSPRAVALLFHHRVVTLLNRNGILLPSSIIVDATVFPHTTEGFFDDDELFLDSFSIKLTNAVDLSFHRRLQLDSDRVLSDIYPFLHVKSHSITSALLRYYGESNSISGIEKAVSDRELKILKTSESVPAAAKRLLGLGFGLTPSGDDFALGIITIFNLMGRDTHEIRQAVETYDHPLSRTILEDALDGYYSESLLGLLESMSRDSAIHDDIEKVLETGHSSGSDILAGMYYALTEITR